MAMVAARNVAKWALCRALSGLGGIRYLESTRRAGLRILVYHRVSLTRLNDGMTVSLPVFEEQLRYLKKNHPLISMDELVEALTGRRPIKPGAITITFDDGYRDNYALAWPILSRYQIPTAIFLAVGAVDEEAPFWTETLREALRTSSRESIDLSRIGWKVRSLQTDQDRLVCLKELKGRLKAMPDAERQHAFLEVLKALDCQEQAKTEAEMLTWDMVREMRKEGVTIGAHTISHRILTQIDLAEAEWEVTESKRRIEQQLGEPIKHFAYPNGTRSDWNSKIQEIVKKAGFETACTTLRGANPVGSDAYALRRLEINDTGCTDPFGRFSPAMFAAQMVGLFGGWER